MHTTFRFIEPLDVLFLRGNKLFGDPGSHGESLMPPWPSVAAGALRSQMLAAAGVDLTAFGAGQVSHPELGTPEAPGSFAITAFDLARRRDGHSVETLHAIPADVLIAPANGRARYAVRRIHPSVPAPGLQSSAPLPCWPVLPSAQREKPAGGLWMTQEGWSSYLSGGVPDAAHVLDGGSLWTVDPRIGIGLDGASRSAASGALFTAQAVALLPGVGFLAGVCGAVPPEQGVLRFGGDGRGAASHAVTHRPAHADLPSIARAGRARIVLTTPGLFAAGWLPPGVEADRTVRMPGLRGRLVCAAVPRAEVASGWDLAKRQPKAAQRMVPSGSVYWLDELDTTPEALRKLAEHGLWDDAHENAQRRAEGFNRFSFAAW